MIEEEIGEGEVREGIRRMSLAKAAGSDNITSEMIIDGGEQLLK